MELLLIMQQEKVNQKIGGEILDLNIFERNNNNSNGFIKEFIRDLKMH